MDAASQEAVVGSAQRFVVMIGCLPKKPNINMNVRLGGMNFIKRNGRSHA